MSLKPGNSLNPDATKSRTWTAAEALDSGQAVALDSNDELIPANSGSSEVVVGVVAYHEGDDTGDDPLEAGDPVEVVYMGPVVATVASGTAGGVEVAASATDGELAAGSGPRGIMTLYAEGSGPRSIPADTAHVVL